MHTPASAPSPSPRSSPSKWTALAAWTALTASSIAGCLQKPQHSDGHSSHSPSAVSHDEHTHNPKIQALIEKHWHNQDKLFEKIVDAGGFQAYFDNLTDKEKAFFTAEQIAEGGVCACCSDEGNTEVLNANGKKMELIRTPGSWIIQALDLEDKNPMDPAFIGDVANESLAAKVNRFTSHAGCGAAKAVFNARIQWLRDNGKSSDADNLEKDGLEVFSKKFAAAVTERMKALDADHAEAHTCDYIAKLHRPPEIHIARCLYLTDIDEFDSSYGNLPQGFVERTGGKKDLKDVLDHVDILRNIAFDSDHAFGTKISEEPGNQFVICCIAETQERLKEMQENAQKKVDTLGPAIARKIRIDGFVRPTWRQTKNVRFE